MSKRVPIPHPAPPIRLPPPWAKVCLGELISGRKLFFIQLYISLEKEAMKIRNDDYVVNEVSFESVYRKSWKQTSGNGNDEDCLKVRSKSMLMLSVLYFLL